MDQSSTLVLKLSMYSTVCFVFVRREGAYLYTVLYVTIKLRNQIIALDYSTVFFFSNVLSMSPILKLTDTQRVWVCFIIKNND